MPFGLWALAVFCGDQISKFLVRHLLRPNESIPVLANVFHLTYINNPGAAFGMLAHQTPFFVAISIIVIAVILVAYRQLKESPLRFQLALALQLGGALGNLVDRLRFGYVVDFLDFRIWPVFNLADVAIVVGVILLGWHLYLRSEKGETR